MTEILNGFGIRVGLLLGWQDVLLNYRRSKLGPFWITISMAVQIVCIALVFGLILKADLMRYVSYLSVGIVLWNFISATISDAPRLFVVSASLIKQAPVPLPAFVIRSLWKNVIIFSHNLVILPIIWLFSGASFSFSVLLVLPGLVLVFLNMLWISFLLGTIGAFFQDLQQIVGPLMTVLFYITPVMWFPELLNNSVLAHYILGLNPIYHLLQVTRLPILGQVPTQENWAASFAFAVLGAAISALVYRLNFKKIALVV